jgi:dethiobiotin synthetase
VSYFITGTDTGVGKTLVSCALLHALAARGRRAVGFKPVAAGCDDDGRNEDAKRLLFAGNLQVPYEQVNPYCLPLPMAPHLAARHAGTEVGFSRILSVYRELAGKADEVVVEGVGGFCVPLNEKETAADLAKALDLPVILVVGMRLGCINHALLTARAIAEYQLECAGWVANVLHAEMPALEENIGALRERISAPLLGVIPRQDKPDAQAAAEYLDRRLLD